MRPLTTLVFAGVLVVATAGCGRKNYDGPTVDSFTGKVTADGRPLKLGGEKAVLRMIHQEKAQTFDVPLRDDGGFTIGWMPIGKYSVMLVRDPAPGQRGGRKMHNVPDGFAIEDGKTDYTIDLGKSYKP